MTDLAGVTASTGMAQAGSVSRMAEPAPALQAQCLSVTRGQGAQARQALREISLSLAAGRWTAVVGPNGAGKSTLLQCLAGLLPHQGQVHLLGRPLAEWPLRERARRLSWLGQEGGTPQDLSAWDVVMLGRLPHQDWLAPPSPKDHAAVTQALQATQAWDSRERPVGQLSAGERQRVLLARALAVDAEVLLMDEPLVNLDPPHQVDWIALVRELVARGKTVVSVLHEVGVALQAQDLVVMAGGQVTHQGACEDPQTHRALEAVFDHRIAVRSLDGQWLALPRVGR